MKNLCLVFLISTFVCCTPSNSKQKEIKAIEIEKQATIKSLKEKYRINEEIQDDHSPLNLYTIDFDKYLKSQYQILTDFSIHDFYEKDSTKYVKIVSDHLFFEMQLELELTDESYELFRRNDDKYYNTSILVYSVSDVKKADFILSMLPGPDPQIYEDAGADYFSVSLPDSGIDDIFLVKGKLIDLIISK